MILYLSLYLPNMLAIKRIIKSCSNMKLKMTFFSCLLTENVGRNVCLESKKQTLIHINSEKHYVQILPYDSFIKQVIIREACRYFR